MENLVDNMFMALFFLLGPAPSPCVDCLKVPIHSLSLLSLPVSFLYFVLSFWNDSPCAICHAKFLQRIILGTFSTQWSFYHVPFPWEAEETDSSDASTTMNWPSHGETLSWDFLRTQLTFAQKRCWRTPWPLLLLWEFLSPYPFLLPCPAPVHIWMVLGGTVTIRVNVFLARFPLSYPTVTPKKKIHMACICVRLGPTERRGFNYYSYYWCLFSLLYGGGVEMKPGMHI